MKLRVATADDALEAAGILRRSFAGHENARLGAAYACALMRSFAEDGSRCLQVAHAAGRVAGFAAGEASDARAARYRTLRGVAALSMLSRPWLLLSPAILRMAAARWRGGAADPVPPSTWFLALIAVDPALQRRGLGHELLRAFENEGRRRGFSAASLLVAVDNAPARTLYERAGWAVASASCGGRVLYARPL